MFPEAVDRDLVRDTIEALERSELIPSSDIVCEVAYLCRDR